MIATIDHDATDEFAQAFSAATNGEYMLDIMRHCLLRPHQSGVDIVKCSLEFARRSSGRVLLQYVVTVRNLDTNEERQQIVTGASYGLERTSKVWEEELRLGTNDGMDSAALRPLGFVPELDVILQVFPCDHRLPALAPLMERTQALLEPYLQEHLHRELGAGSTWSTKVVRYRGSLRACVRLTVANQAGRAQSFFAKVYASDDEAKRAWKVQREVGRHLRARDAGVQIPEPIVNLAQHRILIQEAIPGFSLFALQRQGDVLGATQGSIRAAHGLAAFHQLALPATDHRLRTPRVGTQRIQRSAHRLRATRPSLKNLATLVETDIIANIEHLPAVPPLVVHGDFKPSHVILTAERDVFVDLDKCATGEPMLDVISMMRRLGSQDDLAGTFLREYFRHVPAAWEGRLGPYYAAYLLEHAASIERSVRSRHRASVSSGDERAERALHTARAVLEGVPVTSILGSVKSPDGSVADVQRVAGEELSHDQW